MATQKRTAARPRAIVKKKAAPAKPVRAVAKPKPAPKLKGKPAVAAAKPVAKVLPKGKPRLAVARRGPDPAVRPLGVLPPESRARAMERPLPPVAVRPRPVTPARVAAEPPRSRPAPRLTEKDFKEFEEQLLEERQKIMKEMGHLETTVLKVNQRDSSGDLSGYSFHMADAGTDAMEREKAFLFASAEGRTLMEMNEALRRLYRGEYGVCEVCGDPIARARLKAVPHARLCISCKEKEERESRGAPQ